MTLTVKKKQKAVMSLGFVILFFGFTTWGVNPESMAGPAMSFLGFGLSVAVRFVTWWNED